MSGASRGRSDALTALSLASAAISPLTALFFAEQAYHLDRSVESNAYLYALCLSRAGRHQETLHVLRQPIVPQAGPDGANPFGINRKWTNTMRLPRPAIEISVRCARLYASSCGECARSKEGRLVLSKVLAPNAVVLSISDSIEVPPVSIDSVVVQELELARLAHKASEQERAVISYRKVLQAMPWCWEAFDALCSLRAAPDADSLNIPRSSLVPASPSQNRRSIAPTPSTSNSLAAQSALANVHPPPLGPSQTVVVNSQMPPIRRLHSSNGENMAWNTPAAMIDQRSKQSENTRGPLAAWRKGPRNAFDSADVTLDESSLFDNSLQPVPFALRLETAGGTAPSNGSLFTPTAGVPPPAAGIKRARGASQSSQSTTAQEGADAVALRPVRGVPEKRPPGSTAPTRRSSRLSAVPSSSQSTVSRSGTTRAAKKRNKPDAGPAVLADQASLASPTSASSSPAPSSPSVLLQGPASSPEHDFVLEVLRLFGRARSSESRYQHDQALGAVLSLPPDQLRSLRALLLLGRIYMEMLDYDKAARTFSQAHHVAPHCLDSMEQYSTLLWHLRAPTAASVLAQELMSTSPRSPAAWIATGNVFSLLEDHGSALKCFQRAARLDDTNVYAYTLSGHECASMEEWDRSLGFFREAVRRDPRSYNAWYGIASTYYQSGKYRLAEYHFRKAAELNPTNAILITLTANVLEKLGRRREALDLHERACLLAPTSAAVRIKRVKALMSFKDYAGAERDLIHLRNTAPNEYTVHFYLGKLYKTMGRESDMLRSFALAQDLEPRVASAVRTIIDRTAEMEVDH